VPDLQERIGGSPVDLHRHDAITRNLVEQTFADKEQHFAFPGIEIDPYDNLGEALYRASRLRSEATRP
jgi:hypothetical protein